MNISEILNDLRMGSARDSDIADAIEMEISRWQGVGQEQPANQLPDEVVDIRVLLECRREMKSLKEKYEETYRALMILSDELARKRLEIERLSGSGA